MADGVGGDNGDNIDLDPEVVKAAEPTTTTWYFALAVTVVAVVVGVASVLLGGPILLSCVAFALATVAAVATLTRVAKSALVLRDPESWFWLIGVALLLGLAAWAGWQFLRRKKR